MTDPGARRAPSKRVAALAAALVSAFGGALPAAAQEDGPELPAWLAGCWVARSGGARVDEVWMAPEGGLMVGMSRTVPEGRPPSWELLAIAERGGVPTYSAHPSGQALTHFPATRIGADTLRFENPGHDFPKAIEYRRSKPDSLLALVFGEVDDADPAFGLRYAREPCPGG